MKPVSARRIGRGAQALGVAVVVPVLLGSLVTACSAGSTGSARQAEGAEGSTTGGAVASASAAPAEVVDGAAASPVTCPERGQSGSDFILRRVKIVNESDKTFRITVAPDSWSCDDFSGADNPSALNGLQLPPNPRSPLIIPVRARWDAPNLPVSVFRNNPGSDLPWLPVGRTQWLAGGFNGYAPAQPGTSRLGSYDLRDSDGGEVGMLTFSACNHLGELEEDTWNAIRLWPVDHRPCSDAAGVLDDGLPQVGK